MQLPAVSETFEGVYRLDAVLGAGGFATVFRARDLRHDRDVALKILRPEASGRYAADTAARFNREVQMVARLRDPHTVLLYDHGRAESGLLWMAFEFVEGRDLAALLDQARVLPDEAVLHVLRQVLSSLREAHAHGLIHRDIKPDNIRVFEYMGDPLRVKLLDFGVARDAGVSDARITKTGALVGTPRYMSPEQLRYQPLTPASDIYSLGIVAYEMLAGSDAMHGHRLGDQIARLGDADALRLPARVSERLRAVVDRMVATDVAQRFQTAEEVLRALDAELPVTVPVAAPLRQSPAHPAAPAPRSVQPLVIAVVGVAGFAVVFVALLFGRQDAPSHAAVPLTPKSNINALLKPARPAPTEQEHRPIAPPSARTVEADAGQSSTDAGIAELRENVWVDAYDGPDGCTGPAPPTADHSLKTPTGREVMIEAPVSPRKRYRHPVILAFAGYDTHAQLLRHMRAQRLARAERVIVVGIKLEPHQSWDTDVGKEVLDAVRAVHCIDPQRVFAVGDSPAGGRLVEELACRMPLRGYATANYRSPRRPICRPERRVPSIHFSNLNDGNIPAKGGPSCTGDPVLSLADNEALWRDTHHCAGDGKEWLKADGTTCWTWSCAAPLVSCHVDGGFGWDGKDDRRLEDILHGCDGAPPTFPMAATMWKFFAKQGL